DSFPDCLAKMKIKFFCYSFAHYGISSMKTLPSVFYKMADLRKLRITGTSIKTLEAQVRNWRKLECLVISNNPYLVLLPEEIKCLKKLRLLVLPKGFPETEFEKVKKWLPHCKIVRGT
ncbi:MAG: hypothetical protein RI894_276, partial [Bacteroidota bacterium]